MAGNDGFGPNSMPLRSFAFSLLDPEHHVSVLSDKYSSE
jgi:hypothetical protein